MFFHDQLMKARQEDLLRRAALSRLAAAARRARHARPDGRAVTPRSRLSAAWAGAKPVALLRVSRSEGGPR
jgi:hypothetical protein